MVDIRTAANEWRTLTAQQRQEYEVKAAAENAARQAAAAEAAVRAATRAVSRMLSLWVRNAAGRLARSE